MDNFLKHLSDNGSEGQGVPAAVATGIKLVGNIAKMECATPSLQGSVMSQKWVESEFGLFRVIPAKAGIR